MVVKKIEKIEKKFHCEKCHYSCCYLSDWNKHLSTRKHKMVVNGSKKNEKIEKKYFCECGKSYSHDSGYYRHRKTCSFINEEKKTNNEIETNDYKDMFLQMMEQLKKKDEQMDKLLPLIGNNNNNVNNNFNMNIFLNEQCKDALSIKDFVNNLQLQLNDLTLTGEKGFVEGVSQIFIKGLNELELTKRPIHCSDPKREIMYIKDVNEWKKDKNNSMVKDAIERVKDDNFKQLQEWQNEHPHHQDRDHPDNKIFLDLVQNCLGGTDEDTKKNNMKKIIKNIANEVVVKKEINN